MIHAFQSLSKNTTHLFAIRRNYFSTINKKEMEQFDKIKSWWHPSSQMNVLFQYNYQRIDFLKKIIQRQQKIELLDKLLPFKDKKVLDVGCGAGFLSQSLTRLGANVTGLDPNSTSFLQATSHKVGNSSLNNLKYINCSIEQYLQTNNDEKESFDIITSMDVIEHVDQPQVFLQQLISGLKINSYLMVSTISRTIQTYFTHIVLAQYITKLVPIGTHHHSKFINPKQLEQMFCKAGMQFLGIRQLDYSWKGQFIQKKGGGNYIAIGKKIN